MTVFRRSLERIMSPDKKETRGFIATFKSSKATAASSSSPIKVGSQKGTEVRGFSRKFAKSDSYSTVSAFRSSVLDAFS